MTNRNDCSVKALARGFNLHYKTSEKYLRLKGRIHNQSFRFSPLTLDLPLESHNHFKGRKFSRVKKYLDIGKWIVQSNHHVFVVDNGKVIEGCEEWSRVDWVWKVKGQLDLN